MLPFDNLMTKAQLQNIFCRIIPRHNYFIGLTWSPLRKNNNPGEQKIHNKKIVFLVCMNLSLYSLFQWVRALKLWPL